MRAARLQLREVGRRRLVRLAGGEADAQHHLHDELEVLVAEGDGVPALPPAPRPQPPRGARARAVGAAVAVAAGRGEHVLAGAHRADAPAAPLRHRRREPEPDLAEGVGLRAREADVVGLRHVALAVGVELLEQLVRHVLRRVLVRQPHLVERREDAGDHLPQLALGELAVLVDVVRVERQRDLRLQVLRVQHHRHVRDELALVDPAVALRVEGVEHEAAEALVHAEHAEALAELARRQVAVAVLVERLEVGQHSAQGGVVQRRAVALQLLDVARHPAWRGRRR